MEAESKLLTRRLISRDRGKARPPMVRFPGGKASAYHLWLEMLRAASFETEDSDRSEKERPTPSESPKEA